MQKHVTFNPYVQCQPYDMHDQKKIRIYAEDKKIISLSDRESYLRNYKSKNKINHTAPVNTMNLQTSNLLLMNKNKVKHISANKNYIQSDVATNKVDSIVPMDVDIHDNIEAMEIG